MSRCYILLVNWNGWRDTLECLETLFRLDYPDYRVIVCDNGSTDKSLENIRTWANGRVDNSMYNCGKFSCRAAVGHLKTVSWVELRREEIEAGKADIGDASLILIDNGANLGFAGGNNIALRFLAERSDWEAVWLLNNDTIVASESLMALVNRLHESPVPGICGSTLLYYDEPEKIQALAGGYYCKWIGLPWLFGRSFRFSVSKAEQCRRSVERRMNYVMGASMLVSRAFFDKVGCMDENYFLFFEETDWAWRSRRDFVLGYAPRSIVYHKGGRSIGTSSNPRKKSLTCDYYALRSRLLFSRRHCRETLPTIYLSLFAALLIRICCGRWQNAAVIRDIILGRDEQWDISLRGESPVHGRG